MTSGNGRVRSVDQKMYERLTDRSQHVLALAQEEARRLNHHRAGKLLDQYQSAEGRQTNAGPYPALI